MNCGKVLELERVRLTPPDLHHLTRQQLRAYFQYAWDLYEHLFSSLVDDETFVLQPDPLRHPLVFYLGHTAAFYVNKLRLAGVIDEDVDRRFESVFAKGVDPELPEHLDSNLGWPSIPEVRDYRRRVHQLVCRVIETTELNLPVGPSHPLWSLLMSIEHDLIHFETSSVLIRQLPVERVARPEGWLYAPTHGGVENRLVEVEGGRVVLGKPADHPLFGWDNEYGRLELTVKPFLVARNLVTNGEFLEFLRGGGYHDERCWTGQGWEWRQREEVEHPKFWVSRGGEFVYRAMFDEISLPGQWPVEVNAHEAAAFCRWKGEGWRLLSEAEFALLSDRCQDPLTCSDYNLNFRYGSSTPVGYGQSGEVTDLWGNVWDWLADDFYPLPGFKTHDLYEDFSNGYMDSEHGMMLGGSWATTGTGASRFYRLWFRRHFYQHAGFRLARSSS